MKEKIKGRISGRIVRVTLLGIVLLILGISLITYTIISTEQKNRTDKLADGVLNAVLETVKIQDITDLMANPIHGGRCIFNVEREVDYPS